MRCKRLVDSSYTRAKAARAYYVGYNINPYVARLGTARGYTRAPTWATYY